MWHRLTQGTIFINYHSFKYEPMSSPSLVEAVFFLTSWISILSSPVTAILLLFINPVKWKYANTLKVAYLTTPSSCCLLRTPGALSPDYLKSYDTLCFNYIVRLFLTKTMFITESGVTGPISWPKQSFVKLVINCHLVNNWRAFLD